MNRLRGESVTRRLAAWSAVVGLLAQLAVAAFAVPAAFAALKQGPELSGLHTIVICTGSGMKRITFDAQGNPVEQQDEPSSIESCQACNLAGGFCLHGLAAPDVSKPAYAPFRSSFFAGNAIVEGINPLCPESRGPPHQL